MIGIFTQIGVRSFPATHGPFYLAYELTFVAAEISRQGNVEIQLRDSDGGELGKVEGKFTIEGPPAKPGEQPKIIQQIIRFPPAPFKKAGDYEFAFFLNGNFDISVPFKVTKAETVSG